MPDSQIPPVPVLVAEGFRDVLSVDTVENDEVLLTVCGEAFTLDLVGMMSKTGMSAFTSRKV